ncbi:HNH endonuclease [Amnibacterium kyonggiense]|uniref:HNH endonuclease n=1 Tax=Amnibacterium kyonggiense TaxID=595671 RepID=A0A4R7FLH0_9MICO|nr:HNH endonuclease signature motif containing protein [Amnibacterium kyonggiense]TDS77262.1 HNH endonuclease [Amnibacterium kyonggiense]
MSEPTDDGGNPPPENPYAALDDREQLFTASLQHANRLVNTAAAVRLQVMLAGLEAMLLEEQEQTRRMPSPDDPVVTCFLMHQANELRVTRFGVQRRLEAARILRDHMPRTWAVFLDGLASEDAVVVAGTQAIGLPAQHFDAFDERAAELVQTERATAVERLLSDLRDELDPELTTEQHKEATNRRTVRARATKDGQGVLEIHSTAADIAAAYDRIRKHAVAAHGREGECRTLGALMADCAVDAVLTGSMRGPADGGPSYPFERLGETEESGDVTRKLIDATITVVIPADTATGAGDAPARISGMGTIDAETARTLVAHTATWTRAVVDPVDDVILRFDSHERYIPAGLKRLLHLRQPTCGCGCGLPAHRADIDHIQPFEHDGRTRQENLHVLCRRSHLARHSGFADVTIDEDGTPLWRNKWGGVQRMKTGLRIRSVDETEVTPF